MSSADGDAEPDTGVPDAFMVAAHLRRRRRARNRLVVTGTLAVLTLPGTIVVGVVTHWPWPWLLVGALGLLVVLATGNLPAAREPERHHPQTSLEAAVVVGVEVLTWSSAPGGVHTARVIGRPLGSTTDELVHGTREFPARRGCHIVPGMLFAFRRYPTMRHLVWIEPRQDPLTVFRLRDERPWRQPEMHPATIESLQVDGEPTGDWWPVTVTARAHDRVISDRRPRLPEELAQLEPGSQVDVVAEMSNPLSPAATFAIAPTCL